MAVADEFEYGPKPAQIESNERSCARSAALRYARAGTPFISICAEALKLHNIEIADIVALLQQGTAAGDHLNLIE